jgi:hypothetical protein
VPSPFTVGTYEKTVRADVEHLVTAHPMGESLAEGAYILARRIDQGVEDKSLAGVHKELRETLVELARLSVPPEGGDDDLLSTPVRDSEEPGASDAGAGGR